MANHLVLLSGSVIKPTLLQHAEKQDGMTLMDQATLTRLLPDAGGITAYLEGGQTIRAQLVLAADGKFSHTRQLAGIEKRVITYNQTAMVSVIEHSVPHEGVALERFLPPGPFALLPMQGNRCGVVWTEPTTLAEQMMGLKDEAYAAEIAKRAGNYLGDIRMTGTRGAYPLALILAERYYAERVALIGDSAHAIHPIAGQGVNLGYRDVATLMDILKEAHYSGQDIGNSLLLEKYAKQRRGDVMSMILATDGINRLFSNDALPLRLARRIGLSAVERFPALKHYFMFHAMGLTGKQPDMLSTITPPRKTAPSKAANSA